MKPVIILILVFFAVKLLRKNLLKKAASMGSAEARRPGEPSIPKKGGQTRGEEMVLDPVCGSYVPESSALSASRGNETAHFCSAECRDKFLKG